MVSLEAQAAFWLPLRANTFIDFFLDFLDGKTTLVPPALNPSDTLSAAVNLLVYVRNDDQAAATSLYQTLVARQVYPNSEWIHNDYFVFALVCAVRKFHFESQWVRQVIHARPNVESEKRQTNRTFENLIAGNYNAREDYHQISVVCQLITHQECFDNERFHKMFAHLWRHPFPFFESDFLNIISLRAIRAVFEAKGLLDPTQRFVAEQFATKFLSRVVLLSRVLVYPLYTTAIVALITGAAVWAENPFVKNSLGTLAALGIGAATFAQCRDWALTKVQSGLKKLFGYPK